MAGGFIHVREEEQHQGRDKDLPRVVKSLGLVLYVSFVYAWFMGVRRLRSLTST